ncbi:B12-binding domain-containing radical SAM protein [Veillonella atypica]|uniref:B12 binding domain protein n=1 Tax=Veillonella atypica KON TaxID=1128111 RepID=A0ABP2STC3_9FIRM|nr:B12-binding domain-containing radical SAM protein [Veillonella atypica]EKY20724.1 B12 binding domain protein [Veillonella atypica KON]PQL17749.1 B12-binding domain-containing radical SAM protein [Veillonella atypica KON]SUP06670.1 coproporphyrinogen III oxidase [Veillonella atypica]
MNVVLSTLNSKFIHSSLALRYLKAYGEAHGQAYDIVEYTINMPVLHILSDITEHDIDVLGFACYIWNIEMTLHVVDMVKAVRPDIKIVLGGPEVSFTADELLERCPNIDYIVQGEGEEAFHALVTALQLGNDGLHPVIPGVRGRRNGSILGSAEAVEVRDLSTIPFPYTEEDMDDLEHKIIYYESSRGCPFSCQYCLSGNKNTVRFFPQERTLEELQWFIDHGVKQVKFVDRTFNCAPHHHRPLMEFMRDSDTDMNFHLEMEPELMTEWETNILCETPPGRIQIEVGVQSTYKKTLDAINRYNDWPYIQKSIRPIIQAERTHVHMDLIVGLPHEDFKRFGQSFNDLFSLQPHALQIGFLKLLKGSGVRRMREYKYVADPLAPYEVLSTHVLPYDDVRFLKYFEDVFERFYNSERFRTTFGYIGQQLIHGESDAFSYFCDMTRAWLKEGNHKVNLKDIDQIEFLYRFFLAKGDTIAAELLQYDTLVSYRGKVRSDAVGLPKQTKELLQVGEAFWRNEEIASTFIPNYTFKEWRKIRQQYVEMTMSRETATYLGIQHIPEGDFTVIIDVNKEVTPFIRPENIQ